MGRKIGPRKSTWYETARHQFVLRKWLHGCRLIMEPFGCKRLSTSDESSCSRVENLVLAGLAF
jgi:hypothetical protein